MWYEWSSHSVPLPPTPDSSHVPNLQEEHDMSQDELFSDDDANDSADESENVDQDYDILHDHHEHAQVILKCVAVCCSVLQYRASSCHAWCLPRPHPRNTDSPCFCHDEYIVQNDTLRRTLESKILLILGMLFVISWPHYKNLKINMYMYITYTNMLSNRPVCLMSYHNVLHVSTPSHLSTFACTCAVACMNRALW